MCIFTSCDDDRYLLSETEIGEGEAVVSAEFTFKDYTPALNGSRTAGNVLNGIDNLYVIVYDKSGNYVTSRKYEKSALNITPNTDKPADAEGVATPVSTEKGTFSFPLAYGIYHIYAAANIRGANATKLDDAINQVPNESSLQEMSFTWDPNTIANNDQMFGCFTTDKPTDISIRWTDKTDVVQAPDVYVNKPSMQLNAWLRRLASKVTVDYDGSGLNNGVWVYIKNVTVHDIAAECYLGMKNKPDGPSEVLNRRTGSDNQPDATYTPPVANTRITYNVDMLTHIYDKTQPGLELYNGLVTPQGEPIYLGSDHSANGDALFFYENMQTEADFKNNPRYDKRQQGTGDDQVGENVRGEKDGNDYKDRVPYGTYIEVEGYYISINQDNPSQGPIKYRFMLGKDILYNYDVERNYHYKLTLGFKGWANQPDWHIDYDVSDPNLEVPPVYRVSYLYQQKSSLPVKVSKNCTSLRVEIIENNWAPSDPNDYSFPSDPVASTPAEFQFQWNKAAFDAYYSEMKTVRTLNGTTIKYNAKMPYLGFLALNMPKAESTADIPVTIPIKNELEDGTVNYWSYRDGVKGQDALKDFYELSRGQGSQAYSEYGPDDLTIGDETVHHGDCALNSWSVVEVDDGSDKGDKIVMVPMWTRARTMIEGSGFSGNNPYEYFVRKATLKVTATYDVYDENGNHITDESGNPIPDKLEDYVTVLQEPRIVNPKAVWRKSGSTADPFHVVLMTTKDSNQKSNYTPLKSDGEWTAYVEMGSNVTLSMSETTIGEEKNDTISGKTGTEVDFNININGDGCAVVNVLYHSNNCVHKILVRQGYDQPQYLGGKYWSNFTLQSATAVAGQTDVYNAVETASPFYLGSLYRRGRITKGILEINNSRPDMGPLQSPSNRKYYLTDGDELSWIMLGCENNNTNPAPMGTFRINGENWKVPELADFNQLKDNCEFALGVIYGEATETALDFATATGYYIENADNTDYGVRGVIAYDAKNRTAGQVIFTLGKDGYGRRKNEGTVATSNSNPKRGMLIYSDVDFLLTGSAPNAQGAGNVFRPVPYNLKIVPGAVFWLNNRVADGFLGNVTPGATMSWDVNYFNYDFNSFDNTTFNEETSNCRDACVIKLVKQ